MITLDVVADTYLYSLDADANNNGDTDNEIIVGVNNPGSGGQFHGLIRFDTSTISVPVGFTINVTGVTLNTLNRNAAGGGSNLTIQVYDYGFEFGETTATWNNPAGNAADSTAGGTEGTFLTSSSVSTGANDTNSFDSSAAFISVVENAIGGDNTVNLLLKRSSVADTNSFTRFLSLRSGDPGFELVVDYDLIAVPEPATALLGGLGVLLLLRRRR